MGGSCRDEVPLLKEICCSGGQQHLHIINSPQSLHLSEVALFLPQSDWIQDVESSGTSRQLRGHLQAMHGWCRLCDT